MRQHSASTKHHIWLCDNTMPMIRGRIDVLHCPLAPSDTVSSHAQTSPPFTTNHQTQGLGVEKDLGEVFRLFSLAAASGHTWASYNLGLIYDRGLGVERDEKLALVWATRAAEGGLDHAQRALGWVDGKPPAGAKRHTARA